MRNKDLENAWAVQWIRQEKCAKLEEENKKLKEERDLYKARNEELNENCFWLAKENKKLKEKIKETQETLEHRDSFFSIMRDVLENEKLKFDFYELREILYCVVHFECGDLEMSKKEVEIAEKFWFRDYV